MKTNYTRKYTHLVNGLSKIPNNELRFFLVTQMNQTQGYNHYVCLLLKNEKR